MYTGHAPTKKKRCQDNGKCDKDLKSRMDGWYSDWEKSGSWTAEQKCNMWFKILKENGVGF